MYLNAPIQINSYFWALSSSVFILQNIEITDFVNIAIIQALFKTAGLVGSLLIKKILKLSTKLLANNLFPDKCKSILKILNPRMFLLSIKCTCISLYTLTDYIWMSSKILILIPFVYTWPDTNICFTPKLRYFLNHIFNAASGKLYCQAFPLFVHSFNSLPLIPFGILPHNILILRPPDLE